ncbi:C-X-C chemokine receptor type 3-2 [Brachyhypopomus gauderio]|uniref:C-X-C chemokine receptor type 3-2 n=1 Tax=Brachyhypopomus gauderio TaxID=698409 RepID=UPI004041351D
MNSQAVTTDYNYTYYSDYPYSVDDDSEVTVCSLKATWQFTQRFIPVAYTVVFVLALVGNVLVLCVVQRYRHNRHNPCSFSLTDTFLLHLAVSDLLLALTLPFFAIQWIHGWVFGLALCKLAGALFWLNIYCGVLFLACISFDRYLAIVHAVHTSWRRDTCFAQLTCALIWICCLALAGVEIHFRSVQELDGSGVHLVCRVDFSSGNAERWHFAMQLLNLLLGFGLPLLVMLYCYVRIFRELCHASTRRQKRRSLRLIVSLVVVFVACWAPYNALKMLDSLQMVGLIKNSCGLNRVLDIGILVTESMGLSHCALNPLLYGLVGVKFRHELGLMCKAALGRQGSLMLGGWLRGQGSNRRQTGSFSSADSDNNTYFSVIA